MLEMSLHALRRAPSSQQPAREAPDRVEAKHSAEVGIPRQWDAHRRSHSIQQKSMHRKQDKEDSRHSAEDQYWQNLDARAGTLAQQCEEREMWDARGLIANNDDSGGVEGLSRPRRGRESQRQRKTQPM